MEVPAGLADLGFDPWFTERWVALGRPSPVGRAARLDRGWCTVWLGGDRAGDRQGRTPITGSDDGAVRARTYGQVAVGDWVVLDAAGEKVDHVLERRSVLARRASFQGALAQEHIVATNVDTVFLIHALVSPPNQRRLERELVLVYESGAEPVVVLSKADLADDVAGAVADVREVALGVPVHAVSALTGEGIDDVRAYTTGHHTVALVGASGAGKSTLINALVGHERQRTAEVRTGDRRGRHTTVAAELVALAGGGYLVDTPGLRAVSLWSAEEGTPHGLDRAFSDVVSLAESCRFRDCAHESEPGCAVRSAVTDGRLAEQRLTSWQHLSSELRALEQEAIEVERAARRGRARRRRSGRGGERVGDRDVDRGDDRDDDRDDD